MLKRSGFWSKTMTDKLKRGVEIKKCLEFCWTICFSKHFDSFQIDPLDG